MGYHQAGFDLTGVDIKSQPRYPFRFVQGDALEYVAAHGHEFDFIHASPPCQRYSSGAGKWGTQMDHPDLIPETRLRLRNSGKPYVIENIAPARRRLFHPVMLCGTMFGLGVFRHRLFEANFDLAPPCDHKPHVGKIGDGKYHTVAGHAGGSSKRDGWKNGGTDEWRIAMGIDWMTGNELAESIPPAYTRWIGEQWIKQQA